MTLAQHLYVDAAVTPQMSAESMGVRAKAVDHPLQADWYPRLPFVRAKAETGNVSHAL